MGWARSFDAHLGSRLRRHLGLSPRRLERLVVVAWAALLFALVFGTLGRDDGGWSSSYPNSYPAQAREVYNRSHPNNPL